MADRLDEMLRHMGVRRSYPTLKEAKRQLRIAVEMWDAQVPISVKPPTITNKGLLGFETADGLFRVSRRRDGSWCVTRNTLDYETDTFLQLWGLSPSRSRSRQNALAALAEACWRELQRPQGRRCPFASKLSDPTR